MRLSKSYLDLGEAFYERSDTKAFPAPELLLFNHELAESLGITGESTSLASLLSGQETLGELQPVALAYAGHQFGHFNPSLGDGRAHYIGELQDQSGKLWELQLKGSGPTPFSRGGDGLCGIGPAVREFIMSAALTGLGLPTTRSLSVVTTGEKIFRQGPSDGAVVSRVASSHIRIGTFQYFAYHGDTNSLKQLADYSLQRHFPDVDQETQSATPGERYSALLRAVVQKQAYLISEWMRVGFIHGVMNTDNCTLSGDTIDFGPCAMLGIYDPATVYSSIDAQGRYAFGNQPSIALWNLTRFAECLIPIIDAAKPDKAAALLEPIVLSFNKEYKNHYRKMIGKKMGFMENDETVLKLSQEWLELLQTHKLDYTQSFRLLNQQIQGAPIESTPADLRAFIQRWKKEIEKQDHAITDIQKCLDSSNPYIIPRNHLVEKAIKACEDDHDTQPALSLIEALRAPYDQNAKTEVFDEIPEDGDAGYKTFCGT